MARRNRAAAADAGAARTATGDDPGASGALALDMAAPATPMTGPHDGEALDSEATDASGLVDFGAIRVPVPAGGTVTVEPTANGRMQAVHIALSGGRLSVSALAAPKSSKLWPDLAREIDKSLRDGGARVRSYSGEWGRELHATSGNAKSVFVGVDGPRWMLYGVATGPAPQADALEAELRRMLRGTVVVRGRNPYPVRTVLPLVVPEHLADQVAAAVAKKKAAEEQKAAQQVAVQAAAQQTGQQTKVQPAAQPAAAPSAAAQQTVMQQAAQPAAARQTTGQQTSGQQTTAQPVVAQPGTQRMPLPSRTGAQPPVAPAAAADLDEPQPATMPLWELAPSARRAADGAWRNRSAPPAHPVPNGAEPVPPVEWDLDGPTEVWDALPPEPGATGDVAAEAPTSGSLGFAERPDAPSVEATGHRRLADPAIQSTGWHPVPSAPGSTGQHRVPPGVDGTGRRGPVQPAAEATGRRGAVEPRTDGPTGTGGRRRLAGPLQATGQAPAVGAGPQATGRRHLTEPPHSTGRHPVPGPGDDPVTATGRRRLADPARPAAEAPSWGPGADAGVNGTGRRQVAEPSEPAAESPSWASAAGPGVEGTGRRNLASGPAAEAPSWAPAAEPGVDGTGRRRLAEPAGPAAGTPSWVSAADAGVNGTGRRFATPGVDATGARRAQPPGEPAAGEAEDPLGRLPAVPGRAPATEATGRRAAVESGVERVTDPAAAQANAWDGGPLQGTGRRGRAPAPEVSGWIPVVERTGGLPVEGTGRRRRVEPVASGPEGETPVAETSGRRRRAEPAGTTPDVPADRSTRTSSWPVAAPGTGDARAEDTGVDDSLAFGTGSGGGRRRRAPDATGTGDRLPQLSGPLSAQPLSAQPSSAESVNGTAAAERVESTGGRRRVRQPETPEREATPSRSVPFGSLLSGTGQSGTGQSGDGAQPSEPGRGVGSTGRRHGAESSATSPATSPGGTPLSLAEPRTGRRRASDAPQRGTRRTLGAEYLIDTGEQAVWTGGARRYTPPAESLAVAPTDPGAADRGVADRGVAAEPPAAEPPAGTGTRPRGRHSAPEDGESVTATVPLRALIGELDPNRPSGRHRRPG